MKSQKIYQAMRTNLTVTMPLTLLVSLSLCCSVQAAATPQQLALRLAGTGPFYQLNLPLEVVSNASRDDLADLSVLNAKGEKVVWSWLHTESRQDDLLQQTVPVFALMRAEKPAQVGILIDKQGRLRLNSKTAEPANPAYWLVDLSQLKAQLLEASLTLSGASQGVFPLTIEYSDDLHNWTQAGDAQTILQLSHAGQNLSQLKLNLMGLRARYLRLMNTSGKALQIDKLQVIASQSSLKLPRLLWTPEINPADCTDKYCDYLVPAHFAAEKLEILLPQTNSLARLDVFGVQQQAYQPQARRHLNPLSWLHQHRVQVKAELQKQEQFYLLQQLIAYKLDLAGKLISTPQLTMDGTHYQRLRLQVADSRVTRQTLLGQQAPRIRLAMSELSLIFLARGEAPFSLQLGGSQINPGYAESELLAPVREQSKGGAQLGQASVDIHQLTLYPVSPSAADKVKPVVTGSENRKLWLWGVLLLALALVGGMVWSLLSKSPAKDQDTGVPS